MLLLFCQIRQGVDPGRGKNRSQRVPAFEKVLMSNKLNAQKWFKSMWEEVLLLLVPSRSQVFDASDIFLDVVNSKRRECTHACSCIRTYSAFSLERFSGSSRKLIVVERLSFCTNVVFSARSSKGWMGCWAKIGRRGSPPLRNFSFRVN